jgi:hypothetical protein
MLFEFLMQLLFGWPAMILSLVLAITGLVLRKPHISGISAGLFVLPAWYLSHYSVVIILVPFFLAGSAYAVYRNKDVLAFVLIIPLMFVITSVGMVVLTQ